MKVMFIRHAESVNNKIKKDDEKCYYSLRTSDPQVTEKGTIDATKLGKYILEENLLPNKMFVTSPFSRALQTT
jgi:broad specificity phosphatase PhoE